MFISATLSILLFYSLSPIFFQLTTYLHPIVLVVILICFWAMITFGILFIRNQTINIQYTTFLWLVTMYTIILLTLLFFRPNNQNEHLVNLIPFSTISFYLIGKVNGLVSFYNLAANIALFIPYGILLMLQKRKKTTFVFIFLPFASISIIEFLQFLTKRGSLDIDDLILNMMGVFLGYLIFPLFKRVIKVSL